MMSRKMICLAALAAMLISCKKHVVKLVVISNCNMDRLVELNVGNNKSTVVAVANLEGTLPHIDTAIIYSNLPDTFEVSLRQPDENCFEKREITFGNANKILVIVSICKNGAQGP